MPDLGEGTAIFPTPRTGTGPSEANALVGRRIREALRAWIDPDITCASHESTDECLGSLTIIALLQANVCLVVNDSAAETILRVHEKVLGEPEKVTERLN